MVDQVTLRAEVARNFDEPVGVRAVVRTHHQHQIRAVGHVLYRYLTVFCRVANILRMRADDPGELHLQRLNNVSRLIERQGRLRQIRHVLRIGNLQRLYLFPARNHLCDVRRFAQRAFNLVVIAVPDQHQRVPLLRKLDCLDVDLGHQRAGASITFSQFLGSSRTAGDTPWAE